MITSHIGEWLDRFAVWADSRDDVRAAAFIGSRGRQDFYPADDALSDLDVLVVTTKPGIYASSTAWMQEVAPVWTALVDDKEEFWNMWPVLCGFSICDGPIVVDYVILSTRRIRRLILTTQIHNRFPGLWQRSPNFLTGPLHGVSKGFRYGVKILVDKDDLIERLGQVVVNAPIQTPHPPTQEEFQRCIDNFWYGVVLVTNYLRRGRFFYVKREFDKPGKKILLQMIEWQARSGNNWQDDTIWYRDKWIEQWADPRAVAALPEMFGAYSANALWQSLFAQIDCFRWLTAETAERLGYAYSSEADHKITPWVKQCFQETIEGG